MPATCFECGEPGHIAADCPNNAYLGNDGKPPWCGTCDERTRLVDRGTTMTRCRNCHPKKIRHLPQYRKCPGCQMEIFMWDQSPCGKHDKRARQPNQLTGWNTQ